MLSFLCLLMLSYRPEFAFASPAAFAQAGTAPKASDSQAPATVPKASAGGPTASPSLPPGLNPAQNHNPLTGPQAWQSASCQNSAITDQTTNPSTQWSYADADDAWYQGIGAARNAEFSGISYSEGFSNFFKGPVEFICASTSSSSGCRSYVQQCINTDSPAGFLILNSFVAISNLNYNTYDAISKAETSINPQIGSFSGVFAPQDDLEAGVKFVLDILGLGFALFASPLWNAAFKKLPFFDKNGNTLSTIKDWVNPSVSNGITISKDTSLTGTKIATTNKLEDILSTMVSTFSNTINIYNEQIFNGSDSSNSLLFDQITRGQVLQADFEKDEPLIISSIERAIFGLLIPQAWSLSNKGLKPVVLSTGASCGTDPITKYVTQSTDSQTSSCFNGNVYYLVTPSGEARTCEHQVRGQDCISYTDATFATLPGTASLDGSQWGGITRDDLVAGAVNTYKSNGNKNGAPLADPSNDATLTDISQNGIRAAGIVSIPVCSAEEAFNNWLGQNPGDPTAKFGPNYPCN